VKIALVEAPAPWLVRQHTQAPLGLLYLAAALRRRGHDVGIVRPKNVPELMGCHGCDVIGFGGTTLENPSVVAMARWVRKHLPKVSIWYGGIHVTAMGGIVDEGDLFDCIVVGEADGLIGPLSEIWEKNLPFNRIQRGVAPQDLDALEFPARDLLTARGGSVLSFHEDCDGSENLITSRGCPYSCAFCASQIAANGKLRWRSAESVIAELDLLLDGGIRTLRFEDDNFTANIPRLRELTPRMSRMPIRWHASARAQNLTPEVCDLLVQAHCQELSVGIESGDQRVLDRLNKKVTIDQLVQGCQNAHDAGIHVRALWMTGTPGEEPDTPELNLRLMERLKVHSHALATFIPLPGTPVWNNPEKFQVDIIDRDFRHYNQWLWRQQGGHIVKAEYHPLIRNWRISTKTQHQNVYRMRNYVLDSGVAQPG